MSITGKYLRAWLPAYGWQVASRVWQRQGGKARHLIVAVCDHHEPRWKGPDEATARARVDYWRERYPRLAERYRDADGRHPQHSFFYPGEEYSPELMGGIDELVRAGLGEVELHLHHDGDTAQSLRAKIERYLAEYAAHGHFSRAPDGTPRYAFIHGNWALANGRPDGRWCGVDAELPLLFETGCYADFTFPSCPDPTQSKMVNAIYWPTGDLARRRAYDAGEPARVGASHDDRILLITGPIAVTRRAGKRTPRLEYADLTARDPVTVSRVRSWVAQGIAVQGRPDWVFVKLHTHGSPEHQAAALLGEGGTRLHDGLAQVCAERGLALHYVTAREMYNIARAAMDGQTGDPNDARDHVLRPPPIRGGL